MRVIIVGGSGISSFRRFEELADALASGRARTEMMRGVIDAGRKTKTPVQRAVFKQMALKPGRYNSNVVSGTRGIPRKEILAYDIFGVKRGAPIEDYKGLKALSLNNKLNAGRAVIDKGSVRSGVWNNPRIFKRSFGGTTGGFYAMRPASEGTSSIAPRALWTFTGGHPDQPRGPNGKFVSRGLQYGKVRKLFGPALRIEIGEHESLATFMVLGPANLEQAVMKRMTKIMRY